MNSKIVSTITTSSIFLTIVPIVVGTITALSSLLFMIGVENVQAQVIDEIPVGDAPTGIAHDPVNGHMYVTNQADDTVHVIDTTTNEVIGEIPVGDAPTGIALDSVNGQMYVTNQHDNTVHVIDINNGEPGETANLFVTPGILCYAFGGNDDFCTQLENTITRDQFSISVAGNSPMPSQFLGSEAGQNVELGAGDFTVTVIPLPSVADDMQFLDEGVDEEDVDVQFDGPDFQGACSLLGPGGSLTATGNIAAGQSETCKIVLEFTISPPDDPDG